MKVEKLKIFLKVLEDGIKITGPTSDQFVPNVIKQLKSVISEETDLNYLDPKTFAQVTQLAKTFWSNLKILYRSSKVFSIHSLYKSIPSMYTNDL